MNTRSLAIKLGAIEVISTIGKRLQSRHCGQPFDYLLVLDFEATCWKNTNSKKHCSEIIEFPVVLYGIKNDKIIEEFQQYVMPTENPKLSDFCTALTGIQQSQVDNGVPLQTCLSLFTKWLKEKMLLYNMEFPSDNVEGKNKCIFVTWSDWDLGKCLKNECNRKGIKWPEFFRKWIDIRAIYKLYYTKPFTGLVGAMENVGLNFEGNQHCGLHDARNTAKLAGRLIANGVTLEITT